MIHRNFYEFIYMFRVETSSLALIKFRMFVLG